MGDELYLRDGESYTNGVYYPETPPEQVEEEAKQKGTIAASYPVMDEIADWFQKAIADSRDMTNIDLTKSQINGIDVTLRVSAESQVLAYQLLTQLLQDKAAEFGEFGEDHS